MPDLVIASKGGRTVASTTQTQAQVDEAVGLTAEEIADRDRAATSSAAGASSAGAGTAPGSDTGDENESEEQREFRRKGGWQRRIGRLQDELEEERSARRRLEAQLAGKPAGTRTEEAAAGEDVEPTEEGNNPKTGKPWKDWKEFSRAHADWSYRQAASAEKERSAQAADQQQLEKNLKDHQARIRAAQEQYDDWDDVADSMAQTELSHSVGIAIIELENGPDVLYKLAKDPALLEEIRGLSDHRAIMRLGKISDELLAAKAGSGNGAAAAAGTGKVTSASNDASPKPKPRSAAPAPITPVRGTESKTTPDRTKIPLSDYIKGRNNGSIK